MVGVSLLLQYSASSSSSLLLDRLLLFEDRNLCDYFRKKMDPRRQSRPGGAVRLIMVQVGKRFQIDKIASIVQLLTDRGTTESESIPTRS